MLDGREGTEFEAGNVGKDGGAARADAVLDEEGGEFAEEEVDLDGGLEVGGLVAEGGGEVGVNDVGIGLDGVS